MRTQVFTRVVPANPPPLAHAYSHPHIPTRFLYSGGGSTDASCVYQCNAKPDAAVWAAVGCVVSGNVTGTRRSDLGDGTTPPSVAAPPHTYAPLQLSNTIYATLPSIPGAGVGILLDHLPGRRARLRGHGERCRFPPLPCPNQSITTDLPATPHLGNPCDLDNAANAVSHADYSDCSESFQTCEPTCSSGYKATTPASTMNPLCDANGRFDGANSLVCEPNSCDVSNVGNAVFGAHSPLSAQNESHRSPPTQTAHYG